MAAGLWLRSMGTRQWGTRDGSDFRRPENHASCTLGRQCTGDARGGTADMVRIAEKTGVFDVRVIDAGQLLPGSSLASRVGVNLSCASRRLQRREQG